MARTKKSLVWAICNLAMALVLIFMIVFAFTYDLNARQEYINGLEDSDQQLGEGIGTIFIVVFMLFACIWYGIMALILLISSIGLFSSGKRGFVVTGAIGKLLSPAAYLFMLLLTVSTVCRIIYGFLAALYLAGAIVDFVMNKKLKAVKLAPEAEVQEEKTEALALPATEEVAVEENTTAVNENEHLQIHID